MLVLGRKTDQTISIGDNIKLTVLKVRGDRVQIGIEAPTDLRILRGEIVDKRTEIISLPISAIEGQSEVLQMQN